MIRRLQWRAQVVISILSLVLIANNSFAQYNIERNKSLDKNVTLKEQVISFEQVLHQLSTQTQFYFIYNASSVAASRTLAVAFQHQPLASVLKSLEEKMNVTFRVEGKYIIVKNSRPNERTPEVATSLSSPRQTNPALSTFASARPAQEVVKKTVRTYPFAISHQTLEKNLLRLPYNYPVVDTSIIKKYAMLQITNPKRVNQLFTSIRLIANEYSGGLEIHAGMRSLYAVVNGGLMTEGYFRYGYGLGTSIPLKSNLILKPIYTLATIKEKQDFVVDPYTNIVIADGLKLTGRHHQLKFIFQYELSPRVHVHLGPTFNFLKTSYAYEKSPAVVYDVVTSVSSPVNQGYGTPTLWMQRTVFVGVSPADGYTYKSWSGFEAGISYLIKFPRH